MSASRIYWDIWYAEAKQGRLVVPNKFVGDDAKTFNAMLRFHLQRKLVARSTYKVKQIDVYVDCVGGDPSCWKAFDLLERIDNAGLPVRAYIFNAWSAGIIIAMGARRRYCYPNASFMWHGSTSKPGFDESDMSDEDRCSIMANRTKMSYDWWMEHAASGDVFKFGSNEAIEYGVCESMITIGERE